MCAQEINQKDNWKSKQRVFRATNPLLSSAQEKPAMSILTPAEAWILILWGGHWLLEPSYLWTQNLNRVHKTKLPKILGVPVQAHAKTQTLTIHRYNPNTTLKPNVNLNLKQDLSLIENQTQTPRPKCGPDFYQVPQNSLNPLPLWAEPRAGAAALETVWRLLRKLQIEL